MNYVAILKWDESQHSRDKNGRFAHGASHPKLKPPPKRLPDLESYLWRIPNTGKEAFVKELDIKEHQVSPNTTWSYMETPKGQTGVHLKHEYGDTGAVELYWLNATKRGSGREAMARIAAAADKHGIVMRGWAVPLPGQGENEGFKLSRARLEKFYKGFGFKVMGRQEGNALIVRVPKGRVL